MENEEYTFTDQDLGELIVLVQEFGYSPLHEQRMIAWLKAHVPGRVTHEEFVYEAIISEAYAATMTSMDYFLPQEW